MIYFLDIRNLDVWSNEDLDFAKAKTKEATTSLYITCNDNLPQNLSYDEFMALEKLSKNKDLIIQKYDKGTSMVTVDRSHKKMDNILSDQDQALNHCLENTILKKPQVDQIDPLQFFGG